MDMKRKRFNVEGKLITFYSPAYFYIYSQMRGFVLKNFPFFNILKDGNLKFFHLKADHEMMDKKTLMEM